MIQFPQHTGKVSTLDGRVGAAVYGEQEKRNKLLGIKIRYKEMLCNIGEYSQYSKITIMEYNF